MKKVLKVVKNTMMTLLVGVLVLGLAFTTPKGAYTTNCVVIEVNAIEVILEDVQGNLWAMDNEGSLKEGQQVAVTFDNMGTKTIYDDRIVLVK